MANEILFSGLGDLTIAAALDAQFLLLLADRNALPNHPALMYRGDIAGSGSNALKVPHVGLMGYDLLSAGTEGTAIANTALTDASSTITVSPRGKSYEAGDVARFTDRTGVLNLAGFAADAVASSAATLVSLVANVTDDFTTVVGTSGVDAQITDFLDCVTTLEIAKVAGPYLGILHPVQWGDIRRDAATASGGAIQWNADAQMILSNAGLGYKGRFLDVDVFTTTHVPTANAGADRAGGVFGPGGVLWADSSVIAENPNDQIVIGGKVLFERERTAKAQLTSYVTWRHLGVAKGIDTAGVSLITDA